MPMPFQLPSLKREAVLTFVLSLSALSPSIAIAAQEVLITATRLPTLASSVIPAVTVYGREEIEASGAWSLADLIARQPGVEMGRNGGQGAVTSFFLRGAESKNVLVLLDGQRMRDGVTQSALAENIPLELIERVEVIRGNVSALYGDGAVGGVILVTTCSESSSGTFKRVSLGVGQESSRELGLSLGSQVAGLALQMGLSHVATRGGSSTDPSKTFSPDPTDGDRDPYERTAAQFSVGLPLGRGQLRLSQQSTWAHVRFDNDWMGLDPRQSASADLSAIQWSGPLQGEWSQSLSLQRAEHLIETNTGTRNQTKTQQISWSLSGPLGPGKWMGGLENRTDERSPADGDTGSREIRGFFMTWMMDSRDSALSTQIALRHDDPDDLRARSTYMAGLGWRLSPSTRLTTSLATAFRVPDGYALSTNPGLQPEDTRSVDVGLDWRGPQGQSLKLVAFQGRTTNPIVYDESYTARNLSEMKNTGLELEALVPLHPRWQLRVHLTGQNPRSPQAVYGAVVQPTVWVQSARRAKWFGDAQLEGRWRGSDLRLKISGASARRNTDSDGLGEAQLAGYALVSVGIRRPIRRDLRMQLHIENLLNQDYSLAAGYPGQGRKAMLSLRWQG
ncbi:BtuB Outer membrane cobalamin receptor protein [Burkholderiales bacterium]